jgi:uncharacterized protein YecT (DUF1311 family)
MAHYPIRSLAGTILALVFWSGPAAGDAIARSPQWDTETGVQSAKAEIARCLGRERADPVICTDAPYYLCLREIGPNHQLNMNDCAQFSLAAWEDRLTNVRSRLYGPSRKIRREPSDAKPLAQLRASDQAWQKWYEGACDVQNVHTRSGSMHRHEIGICMAHQAAARALDLQRTLNAWSH